MQQMMIYWQSVIPQHVSGVFMSIIRRADCVPLPVLSCPGYGCGSGESGGEMCAQCTVQESIGSGTQSALLMMDVKTPETC